jgi:hypothetical protein
MTREEAIKNLEIIATNAIGALASETSPNKIKLLENNIMALDMAIAALKEPKQSSCAVDNRRRCRGVFSLPSKSMQRRRN